MSADYAPLGPGPLPTTGAELISRIDTMLAAHPGTPKADATSRAILARTQVEMDGPDIQTVVIDGTGLDLDLDPETGVAETSSGDARGPLAAVRERTQAIVRHVAITAHPVTISGVEVDIDVQLQDVPFHWIIAVDETIGIEPAEGIADRPVTGHVRARAAHAEILAAVRRIATTMAAEQGVELKDLDLHVTSISPRAVAVRADAKIKRGILGASATAKGTATIDDSMVLRFTDVSLTSGNVIVAGLLGLVRGRVEAATNDPVDLAAALPPGVRVTDISVEAGDELAVFARLG